MTRHRMATRPTAPERAGEIVVGLDAEAGYGAVEWALSEAARRGSGDIACPVVGVSGTGQPVYASASFPGRVGAPSRG